jgi:excisionase family DNA binding protein
MRVKRMKQMQYQGLPFVMTVEQAGELLGISRGAAYQAAKCGEIPTCRIGRRLVVPTPRLLAGLGITPSAESDSPPVA